MAILPYYVANLNIEATYAAISGQFAEFPNLCFVDTLDNVAGLGIKAGYQHDMFAGLSDENVARVRRQNKRKISVIIGNPPYNANQANENDNNKNREYPRIDQLIKSSYIRLSTAQKTKVYDMYARFFRWASDRMADDGVLAFITNRSFIESRTFDGFRKAVAQEFNEIHVLDLGGDVRANPRLSGTRNNVFGIQTGVAISFFVKRHKQKGCKVFYARRPEMDTAEDKLSFLANTKASEISYLRVEPDKNGNWVNLVENDWDEMIPVADKKTKAAKTKTQEKAIFRLFASGIKTNRDEWVYDLSEDRLQDKISFFLSVLNQAHEKKITDIRLLATEIKLSSSLRIPSSAVIFSRARVRPVELRAFVQGFFYCDKILSDRLTDHHFSIFGPNLTLPNIVIAFRNVAADDGLSVLASNAPIDYSLVKTGNGGTESLPRYRYSRGGERVDNITDWGLKEFQKAYGKDGGGTTSLRAEQAKTQVLTKDSIFHYVYAVLYDPLYRDKYMLNLKREFPHIPFYPDFWRWAEWGKQLMELHVGYESVEPWPLERLDASDETARTTGVAPRPLLKADRENGIIRLDTETQLSGIPMEAWDYRLGNRSGLEWILDQYKEKTPKDPTIREKFNTYRFADYKEKVIDLLMRVTRVSIETVAITEAMKGAKR
ncbi:type ISP restriction/modification enzyme [Mesorhizobium sp. BR1-1-15]|uniref:type ISP restriction/modification enzyme n=1 Tax=Mesorhizobium sp. BR1-1-15 TaxID=2876654 RepID=UPI001CC91988|nr:type ISP restriction/modification enzyme [Mesorhizobium sp. BR1-1-15]MBZ9954720.1 Eco57I restriction-modification methylase domain-containing protein [Mesorhizobium sp. BR1-1-15]